MFDVDLVDTMSEALADQGWCVFANALPDLMTDALRAELTLRQNSDELRPAAIGRGAERQHAEHIRSDQILWLDGSSRIQQDFLMLTEQLRLSLNRALFAGLDEFECHFASYGPGARYARHLDSFRGHSARQISLICYLNQDWTEADGGELYLYDPEDENQLLASVPPLAGTMVAFLSERFPHEVRPARRERMSVTGWYRRNINSANWLDPAR